MILLISVFLICFPLVQSSLNSAPNLTHLLDDLERGNLSANVLPFLTDTILNNGNVALRAQLLRILRQMAGEEDPSVLMGRVSLSDGNRSARYIKIGTPQTTVTALLKCAIATDTFDVIVSPMDLAFIISSSAPPYTDSLPLFAQWISRMPPLQRVEYVSVAVGQMCWPIIFPLVRSCMTRTDCSEREASMLTSVIWASVMMLNGPPIPDDMFEWICRQQGQQVIRQGPTSVLIDNLFELLAGGRFPRGPLLGLLAVMTRVHWNMLPIIRSRTARFLTSVEGVQNVKEILDIPMLVDLTDQEMASAVQSIAARSSHSIPWIIEHCCRYPIGQLQQVTRVLYEADLSLPASVALLLHYLTVLAVPVDLVFARRLLHRAIEHMNERECRERGIILGHFLRLGEFVRREQWDGIGFPDIMIDTPEAHQAMDLLAALGKERRN